VYYIFTGKKPTHFSGAVYQDLIPYNLQKKYILFSTFNETKLCEENMTHIEADYYELKACFLYVTQRDRSSMCLHLYWFCMLGKGKDKGHPITGH
jgi:hypothetical protein